MFRSAGVILLHLPSNKVLLVQHTGGHWGFPKGGIEDGETPTVAAVRELAEETGTKPHLLLEEEFSSEEYLVSAGNEEKLKTVIYFIGLTFKLDLEVNTGELLGAQWFTTEEVSQLPGFLSQETLEKVSIVVNSGGIKVKVNARAAQQKAGPTNVMQRSKHAYSRIAPLLLLNKEIVIPQKPETIDTEVINKALRLSESDDEKVSIPRHLSESSRSIIALIPAMLYHHSRVSFHHPQGCNIGERKIDLYLDVIRQFGGSLEQHEELMTISRVVLNPATVHLPFPSFTGTSTALIMASMIDAKSIIDNISVEPEILEMIEVMRRSGVEVTFTSERTVEVRGEIAPNPASIDLSEDRNVLVTKICAALIQGKEFSYSSHSHLYLSPLIKVLEDMGVDFEHTPNSFMLKKNVLRDLKPVAITTGHYPAFCSDWQPLIAPILCKIAGESSIEDTVFEKRFDYIEEIRKINSGFTSKVEGKKLVINGGVGTDAAIEDVEVRSLDIRSGAANIIAALGGREEVLVSNICQLFRGYEDIVTELGDISGGRISYAV